MITKYETYNNINKCQQLNNIYAEEMYVYCFCVYILAIGTSWWKVRGGEGYVVCLVDLFGVGE